MCSILSHHLVIFYYIFRIKYQDNEIYRRRNDSVISLLYFYGYNQLSNIQNILFTNTLFFQNILDVNNPYLRSSWINIIKCTVGKVQIKTSGAL